MELGSQFTTSVQRDPTSRGRTELQTALFQCFVSSTILPDTSTKAVASERVQLQSTLNHGTQISSNSSTCARTTARKKCVLEICFTHCGLLICSCNALKRTKIGPSSARMNALDCRMLMVRNSRNSTNPTKLKDWLERPSLLVKYGTRLLRLKLKQEHRTCSTRMQRISSPTRRIWGPSVHPTSVLRSWNTLQKTKSLCATSHPSLFQSMLKTVHSIMTFFSMSPITQQVTSTA